MPLTGTEQEAERTLRMQTQMRSIRGLLALPKHLYHYTSASGLVGIVSEHRLRATNYAYLNDSAEMEYGRAVIDSALKNRLGACRDAVDRAAVEHLWAFITEMAPATDQYLTCFCAEPDLLSQWRGYGADSGSFCIEFEPKFAAPNPAFAFGYVLYDGVAQTKIVDEAVSLLVAALRTAYPSTSAFDDRPGILLYAAIVSAYLVGRAAFFKAYAFHEEMEWRAVDHPMSDDRTSAIDFSVGRGLIRPYTHLITAQTAAGTEKLPITKIIVGATRYPREAMKSVKLLLEKAGYEEVPVELSSVTLRP